MDASSDDFEDIPDDILQVIEEEESKSIASKRPSFSPSNRSQPMSRQSVFWPSVGSGKRPGTPSSFHSSWVCSKCTFENQSNVDRCTICSTPRPVIQSTIETAKPVVQAGSQNKWKDHLNSTVRHPDAIRSSPITPTKPMPKAVFDPIRSTPMHSQSISRSQMSLSPRSPKAVSAEGFPVLDPEASKTWIYPTNYPIREYQLEIVSEALFKNTLVSLPTGLGKTFIAAVVMFNFYRWFPAGKVIFLAPTRPLVTQQIGACHDIVGIPHSDVAELMGTKAVTERKRLWAEKRVFYCTPQILDNDLRNGIVNARRITCLVVDECHRAQGDYAYTTVLRQLRAAHRHFRVLGLSATPGTDIDKVQRVIVNLDINAISIRSRDDPDVRKYLKQVLEEEIVVKLNSRYQHVIEEWLAFVMQPLNRLCNLGVLTERNPRKVNKMILLEAQTRCMEHRIQGLTGQRFSDALSDIGLLMSLTQATQILTQYGVGAFVETLSGLRQEAGEKPNPSRVQLVTSSRFISYYNRVFEGVRHNEYVHPKLEKLKEFLVDHFRRNAAAERDTRVIVFAQYRSSVQEILNYLRGTDLLRPTAFVGQQKKNSEVVKLPEEGHQTDGEQLYDGMISKPSRSIASFFGKKDESAPPAVPAGTPLAATNGQTQKQQQAILSDFKSGKFNVLVATCIAEEGLDIGEVDLLVCYEGVSSPTRLLQRKGRTGRKRAGRVVVLLTEGSEYQKHKRSIQKYNQVTTLLKNKSTSLQLCPMVDTLFDSHFHPQLVKESLVISDYHYSQIGGHTPKKRNRNTVLQEFRDTPERRNRQERFFASEQGRWLFKELEKEPEDREVNPCAINRFVSEEDSLGEVYQWSHSRRSHILQELREWVMHKRWCEDYSSEQVNEWVKQESKHRGSTVSLPKQVQLLNEIQNSDSDDSSLDDFCPIIPRSAPMSVLDMVEKRADAMLRRLDWENVNTSSTNHDIETPSVLKEVDAMAEEPNSTVVPVASLDAILEADSDASLQLSSENEPLAKNQPIPVEDEIIEVSDTSIGSPIAVPESNDDSDDIPIAALEIKKSASKDSITSHDDHKVPKEVPILDLNPGAGCKQASVSLTESEESSSDELLGDLLSQSVLLAWEKHQKTVSKSEPTEVNQITGNNQPTANPAPVNNQSAVQTLLSPDHSSQKKVDSPLRVVAQQDPAKEVSPTLNPSSVKPVESKPSAVIVTPVKDLTLREPLPGRTDPANTSLGTSEINDNSLSTNSNSVIPIVTSSFSALEVSTHSLSGDEAFKPSPLTREEIDRLFPRVPSPYHKDRSTPETHRVQGIVCPLCLALCDTPERLRSHLNHDCQMLPQKRMIEEQVSSGVVKPETMISETAVVRSTSDPPSTCVQSSVQIPVIQQAPIIPAVSPPKTTSVHPVAAEPPPDDLDLSSAEIDALLHMDLNSTLQAAVPEMCCICRDSTVDASNPLLCCALCGVVVHTSCYGVVPTSSSRWQCDRCDDGVTGTACGLCGQTQGAMKCSVDGVWVHVPCVTWNPQLLFQDIETLRPAEIRPLLAVPSTHRCIQCGRAVGVPVKCHTEGCCNYYHVSCAQDAGCVLDAETEGEGVVFTITCLNHTFLPSQPKNDIVDISDGELSDLVKALDKSGWEEYQSPVRRDHEIDTGSGKRFCDVKCSVC